MAFRHRVLSFAILALLVGAIPACRREPPRRPFTLAYETGPQFERALLDSLPIGTPIADIDAFADRVWLNCTRWDTGRPTALIAGPVKECELAEWMERRAIFQVVFIADDRRRLAGLRAWRLYTDRDTAYANANGIALEMPTTRDYEARRALSDSLGVTPRRTEPRE